MKMAKDEQISLPRSLPLIHEFNLRLAGAVDPIDGKRAVSGRDRRRPFERGGNVEWG